MELPEEVQEQNQKSIFEEVLEEIRKEQQAMEAQSEDFSNEELEVEQEVELPEEPKFVEPIPDFNFYDEAKTTIRSPKKTVKPAILQEEQEKPKEKIDPKKLVLYSEIMEPKYKH